MRYDTEDTTVVTTRGQVSIPAAIRKALGLRPGQKLRWEQTSERGCQVWIVSEPSPIGARQMLGYARRLREQPTSTAEWMRELRDGDA